jgi:hypothetical protein
MIIVMMLKQKLAMNKGARHRDDPSVSEKMIQRAALNEIQRNPNATPSMDTGGPQHSV